MSASRFHSTSVDRKVVEIHLFELIDRCGSTREAAKYASIGTSSIYRITHRVHNTVQRKTATKILKALVRKREEDRVNKKTHIKLKDKQDLFAKIERNL